MQQHPDEDIVEHEFNSTEPVVIVKNPDQYVLKQIKNQEEYKKIKLQEKMDSIKEVLKRQQQINAIRQQKGSKNED